MAQEQQIKKPALWLYGSVRARILSKSGSTNGLN